jgi:serine/threonine protein kinase
LDQLFNSIKSANLVFPHFVSNSAKELITSLMNRIPERRPNINSLKHFFFFRKLDWDAILAKKVKPPKIVKAISAFVHEENYF